jgi:hypothetical protein
MNSKIKNKMFDFINSNYYENSIRKSQNNIFIDTEQYTVKSSFSSPKYKNKTKENIEEILNKSLNDFTINTNKNLIKKSYFDDIKTSLNKNNIIVQHKEFDYDNFLSKMLEKRKQKRINKEIKEENGNIFNKMRKNISQNNILKNSNNNNLLNKIFKFTSEICYENSFLDKNKSRKFINLDNNSHLNILTLSKGYLSSKNNNLYLPKNRYDNNNSYINRNYYKSKSLKFSNNNYNKIDVKDERDRLIDKFMKKNEKNNNDYFSNQQKKNIAKKLNLNF